MIRNIIWDVDGTLFNSYPAIAKSFIAALNEFGKDTSLDWIEILAKISLSHCVSTLAQQFQLEESDLGSAFEKHYDLTTPEEQPPFPGVKSVCEYISNLGGKNIIVTHRDKESTYALLAVNNMTKYFSGCLARDEGYPKKPHPAAFEAVIKIYNLQREETMAVGDRDIDILAGQSAGVFTCLIGYSADGTKADLIINNFDELFQYISSKRN